MPSQRATLTRFVVVLFTMMLLISVVATATDAEALTPEEDDFIELINQERADAGLDPVTEYWDLTNDARAWSDRMMTDGFISHNPNLAGITTNWLSLAENVGVGSTVTQLHSAFMASSTHKANILNPAFDHVGVGVTHPSGGSLWVTIDFMNTNGASLKEDPNAPVINVERAAGRDRYATAADISATMFPTADTVYIATGQNFPDALAAGPAAGHENAPVLYVKKDSVPQATINELNRLKPETIIVTGGTAVVSTKVYNQLASYATNIARRSGPDRYATAAAISKSIFPTSTDVVYVASGATYPGALVAGPAAIKDGAPLLLVKPDVLPTQTRNELVRLNPQSIILVGGTLTVSSSVEAQLRSYAPKVTRLAGANRWSTGQTLSASTFTPGNSDIVYIAYGYGWPDSVAGTAAAAQAPGPILLLKTYSIPSATRAELARLDPERIMVFGGTAVVADSVVDTLNSYVK
jgi:putative cell wall-binding protein